MVMLVVLPLVHLPAFRTNVGLIYLTKVVAFWSMSLMMLLWFCIQRRDFRRVVLRDLALDRPLLLAAIALLVTVVVSCVNAPDPYVATLGVPPNCAGLVSYIAAMLFVALSVPAFRVIPRRRLLPPAYAAFSVLALAILWQFLIGDFLFAQGHGAQIAVMAGFGNRNYAALPFSWLFLLSLAQSLEPSTTPRRRLALLIPLTLCYSVVLVSLTRGTWVAVGAALTLLVWFLLHQHPALIRRERRQLLIIALVLVLTPALLNGLSQGALVSRVDATAVALNGSATALETASSGRWGIWRAGIALLAEPRTLLTGIGPNSFYDVALTSPLVQRLNWQPVNNSLHNQYLESLVTLGIPGFCTFFAVGIILCLRARHLAWRNPKYLGPWLCLGSLAVNLLFSSLNFAACIYFWPLIAAIIAGSPTSHAQPPRFPDIN
jgi:O-antigen ligase